MKPLLRSIILFLFMYSPFMGQSQESIKIRNPKVDLVGVWNLTFYNEPYNKEFWEFKSDSVFNVLKGIRDGDSTLIIDENGSWKLEKNILTITITGEDTNGKQQLYEVHQVLKFEVIKQEDGVLLKRIDDKENNFSIGLTRKK